MIEYKENDSAILFRVIYIVIALLSSLMFVVLNDRPSVRFMVAICVILFVRIVSCLFYSRLFKESFFTKFLLGPAIDVIEMIIASLFIGVFGLGVISSILLLIPFLAIMDFSSLGSEGSNELNNLSFFTDNYKKSRGLTKKTQIFLLENSFSKTLKLFNLLDSGAELTNEQIAVLNNSVEIAKQREIDNDEEDEVIHELGVVIELIYKKLKAEMNEKEKEEKTIRATVNEGLVDEINSLKELI